MRKVIMTVAAVIFITLLLPLAIIFIMGHTDSKVAVENGEVSVYLTGEDKVVTVSEDDYLCGALMSYMPADYDKEALKAGAIALRSFLYAKKDAPPEKSHHGAMVCDDYSHCVSYTSRDVPKSIQDAASETAGQIIEADGKAIEDLAPLKTYDAQNKARQGLNCEDILKSYFPDGEIKDV